MRVFETIEGRRYPLDFILCCSPRRPLCDPSFPALESRNCELPSGNLARRPSLSFNKPLCPTSWHPGTRIIRSNSEPRLLLLPSIPFLGICLRCAMPLEKPLKQEIIRVCSPFTRAVLLQDHLVCLSRRSADGTRCASLPSLPLFRSLAVVCQNSICTLVSPSTPTIREIT